MIRAVILQCEQQNASEDLIQLLLTVHERINCLNGQFQQLCNARRDYAFEMGFSCPLENEHFRARGPGRPRIEIPEEVITGLQRRPHGTCKEVAILQNNSTKVTSVFYAG